MQDVFERIVQALDGKKLWFETERHEPVFTSQQAATARGVQLRMGVKAMVLKGPRGFFLVLVRADKRVDVSLVKRREGGKVRLATAAEVLDVTGCEIGSVPPFGFAAPLRTYLDPDVLREEKVTFNAGLHDTSVVMKGADLSAVVEAVLL